MGANLNRKKMRTIEKFEEFITDLKHGSSHIEQGVNNSIDGFDDVDDKIVNAMSYLREVMDECQSHIDKLFEISINS